jgi:NAD(P)H-nitrite reductase large subunit
MAPAVGTAMYRSVTNAVVEHITKNGGHIMTGKLFKEFRDGKVVVNNLSDGFDHELDFDAVVVAMGVKPNYELIGSFEAAFDKVSVVGDTIQPGNIADATHSGYDKAFVF